MYRLDYNFIIINFG
ncbi:hypothetical protein F383_36137 [Gossypium arboreum]|uniref:Uncharacterized protein n=1 Tax=Gossypium arboreum TaxID=29729 RepID=A0A0B0N7X3_GOSAR|nr:hypothetical protein F383_36137 [Gossypium arboreum]